jgi:hypothetical protein
MNYGEMLTRALAISWRHTILPLRAGRGSRKSSRSVLARLERDLKWGPETYAAVRHDRWTRA